MTLSQFFTCPIAAQQAASSFEGYAIPYPIRGGYQVVPVTKCPTAMPPKPAPVADRHMVRCEIKRKPIPEGTQITATLVAQSEKYYEVMIGEKRMWFGKSLVRHLELDGQNATMTVDKAYAEKRGLIAA